MNAKTVFQKIGTGALQLIQIGAIQVLQGRLFDMNKQKVQSFNGEINRGFEYYAKPKMEKLKLVKNK